MDSTTSAERLRRPALTRRGFLAASGTAALGTLVALLAGCGGGGGGGGGGSKGTASVTGIVEDSANADAGVANATVTIGGATTTTLATATNGNPVGYFELTGVPVGATTATVTPSGGASQTIAFSPSITTGANALGTLFINIGQVRGVILLADGTVAAGAFVSIAATGDTTTAASDGSFLLVNVPAGATTLTAVLGTESTTVNITVANGVLDLGNVKLAEDTNPNPPSFPNDITGTVLLSDNGAPAGTVVTLFRGGTQIEQVQTDTSGNFGFYVAAGSYSITIRRTSYQDSNYGPFTLSNPNTPFAIPTITLQPD